MADINVVPLHEKGMITVDPNYVFQENALNEDVAKIFEECFQKEKVLEVLDCNKIPIGVKMVLVQHPALALAYFNKGAERIADFLVGDFSRFLKEDAGTAWLAENYQAKHGSKERLVIDGDAPAKVPKDGYKVAFEGRGHQQVGMIQWNKDLFADPSFLYLSKSQRAGAEVKGVDLYKEVGKMFVANVNILDWLWKHQEQIPESWAEYDGIVFWGTVYDSAYEIDTVKKEGRFVWSLRKMGEKWCKHQAWLDFMFRKGYPALLLPNS
jgi:hypothetical protein